MITEGSPRDVLRYGFEPNISPAEVKTHVNRFLPGLLVAGGTPHHHFSAASIFRLEDLGNEGEFLVHGRVGQLKARETYPQFSLALRQEGYRDDPDIYYPNTATLQLFEQKTPQPGTAMVEVEWSDDNYDHKFEVVRVDFRKVGEPRDPSNPAFACEVLPEPRTIWDVWYGHTIYANVKTDLSDGPVESYRYSPRVSEMLSIDYRGFPVQGQRQNLELPVDVSYKF